MKKIFLLFLASLYINSAIAATGSAPMQVAVTISPKCTITANNMSFSSIGLTSS